MLISLRLSNFVLVDSLNLKFENGLNILTGETGAGKSVIVGALDIILGSQLKGNVLYRQDKNASLEAVFKVDRQNAPLQALLSEHEIELEEDELFFAREILKQSSKDCVVTSSVSKSFINGRRVTNAIIRDFRRVLIDFHSQRDQSLLFQEYFQQQILDSYAKIEDLVQDFRCTLTKANTLKSELSKAIANENKMQEKIALYEYQLNEIESMGIKPGEDIEIENELELLSNAEEIIQTSREMEDVLYEQENSVFDSINLYRVRLSKFENDSPHIKLAIDELQNSLASLDGAVSELKTLKESIDLDREKLDLLRARLDSLNLIKNKYRGSLADVLGYYDEIKEKVDTFSSGKTKIQDMIGEYGFLLKTLHKQSKDLSKKRQISAGLLSAEIEKNIKKLAIPEGRFNIRVSENDITFQSIEDQVLALRNSYEKYDFERDALSYFTDTGINRLDFLFSANKGVDKQSIKKAVSGGELSRLLLTIKKILSDSVVSQTIIFDEIDSGIGGKTANILGEFISGIAKNHQVICITHLPQVASFADVHFFISKVITENKTTIQVEKIAQEKILSEIARMLSGQNTELAISHAKELVDKNKGFR